MSDLYCPQCLMPHTIDCREAGCPGEGQFKRLADLKPEAPDRKMLETMGSRIQDLETLVLTLDDFLNGMGPANDASMHCRLIGEEARRIRGQKPTEHVKSGAARILLERNRQIAKEGFAAKQDDLYVNGELRDAAIAYAMVCDDSAGETAYGIFPWEPELFKVSEDSRRNLEKAGALIAAEIDRLDRKEARWEARGADRSVRAPRDGKEGAGHGLL